MASSSTTVRGLTPDRDDWKITVRVISLWRQHAYMRPSEIIGLDFVMVDEQGDRISATVKKHLLSRFEPLIQQGSVYVVSVFGVAENNVAFKMAAHPYRINFYRTTTIKPFTGSFSGSLYGLRPTPLADILSGKASADHALDIVGHVVSSTSLLESRNDGRTTKRITLEIKDLSGEKISCTLWDAFADEVSQFLDEKRAGVRVIVVILLGRIRFWNGVPAFGNCFYGTRVFLNPEIPEIVDFKTSLDAAFSSDPVPVAIIDNHSSPQKTFLSGNNRVTIDVLREVKQAGRYILVGKIVLIQKDEPWHYLACRRCKKGVEAEEPDRGKDGWYCPKCDKHGVDVVERFKLQDIDFKKHTKRGL